MKKQFIIASALAPFILTTFAQGYAAPASSEATGSLTTNTASQVVTLGTLPTLSSIVGSMTGASSVTVNSGSAITFNPSGDIRVTLPESTVITPATGTGFDVSAITTASVSVTSGLEVNESSNGAVEFGISTIGLNFSKPIRIEIPVSTSSSTILVKVKHGGSSIFGTTGLTNNSAATCTNGVPSTSSNVATVSAGVATIYSCSASTFAAYTVAQNNNSGAGGGAVGGSYPIAKTHMTENLDIGNILLTSVPVLTSLGLDDLLFQDIEGNWAMSYIQKLALREVINNTDSYNPEGELTRAEFIKMALKSSGDSSDEEMDEDTFDDVSDTHSLKSYIATAAKKGIINSGSTLFHPDASITRAEAMKILVNILGANTQDIEMSTFEDVDSDSDLSKYIEVANEMGIITGEEKNGKTYFRPNDSITRAEIAKVIANAFKF